MMGGRERKIGLQIRVVAALGPPQSTIHLAFELHQSPTRPTTTGLHENARWQFLQLSPRAKKKKRFHGVAAVESSATAPSFVQACLGEGPPRGSSPGRAVGIPPVATSTSQGEKKRKRWERWKTNKNSTINRDRNTYHSLALFSFQITSL